MILVDDIQIFRQLLPLTFTRSIADCRIGILTIREKWEKYLAQHVDIDYCVDYLKEGGTVQDSLRISSHILPNTELVQAIQSLPEDAALIYQGVEIASRNKTAASQMISYEGAFSAICFPWDFYLLNDAEMRKDYALLTENRISQKLEESNTLIGNDIFIEEGAKVSASILNTQLGPIYIGKNAEIMEGSMIRGPFSLGDYAQVKMGAKIYGATTIGPGSKVGGEITNCVLFGNSNKAHDGYIGNSVLGEWCNLGADTNSSNLKNNYSTVEIYSYAEHKTISSGQLFLGLIMGDHSKSSINTMFNTGTVVGVSANIVSNGFPNKHIPSFSWSIADKTRPYDIEKALETIRIVYGRRNRLLTEREERILRYIHAENVSK